MNITNGLRQRVTCSKSVLRDDDLSPNIPRWRVDIMGRVLATLGRVEAPDEKTAIAKAAEQFNIPLARQNRIIVTKIGGGDNSSRRAKA
jgi:hypothetical protein